jgi:hypothetical protein
MKYEYFSMKYLSRIDQEHQAKKLQSYRDKCYFQRRKDTDEFCTCWKTCIICGNWPYYFARSSRMMNWNWDQPMWSCIAKKSQMTGPCYSFHIWLCAFGREKNMFCTCINNSEHLSILLHFKKVQNAKHRILRRPEYHLLNGWRIILYNYSAILLVFLQLEIMCFDFLWLIKGQKYCPLKPVSSQWPLFGMMKIVKSKAW